MKTPDNISTRDPREAISFGISLGIEADMLSDKFKMNPMAWSALVAYLKKKWDKEDSEELAQIIECFTMGYATATDQVSEKMRRSHKHGR